MSEYYDVSGNPATGSSGDSSTIRAEFVLIEAGLALLPTLSGNDNKIVAINPTGTALESVSSLSVIQGGTGATTLTDGGLLVGSGTGAITALAVLADGEMIVGDGTTDPSIESGATLRTSIGVGTGDSVTFSSLSVTTLTVSSTFTISVADINGGAIDGTTIGATVASTGIFTALKATTITETVGTITANDLDLSTGNKFTDTLTANTTYTFSNAPSGSYSFTFQIINPGSAFTVTLPASVTKFLNGSVGALGDETWLVFETSDVGVSFTEFTVGDVS